MYFYHTQPLYCSFFIPSLPLFCPTHYIWGERCHICLSEAGLFHLMWWFPVSSIFLQIISFFFKSSCMVHIDHTFLPCPLVSTQDYSVSWLLYILHQLHKYAGTPTINWLFFLGGCYILNLNYTLVLCFNFWKNLSYYLHSARHILTITTYIGLPDTPRHTCPCQPLSFQVLGDAHSELMR